MVEKIKVCIINKINIFLAVSIKAIFYPFLAIRVEGTRLNLPQWIPLTLVCFEELLFVVSMLVETFEAKLAIDLICTSFRLSLAYWRKRFSCKTPWLAFIIEHWYPPILPHCHTGIPGHIHHKRRHTRYTLLFQEPFGANQIFLAHTAHMAGPL